MYFFVLVTLRLMGKREIGKLSVFDLVVSIMMAEIAVVVIEDPKLSLWRGVLPIGILMVTQIVLSYLSLKSKKVRELVEGKPALLIANGKILDEEMKKQRYSIDDLLTQLRDKNISAVSDVEFAILESSGKLSVFPKPAKQPVSKEDLDISGQDYHGLPVPVIEDGRIMSDNLHKINKDEKWLKKQIEKQGYDNVQDVYFASLDHTGKFFVDPKDKGRQD